MAQMVNPGPSHGEQELPADEMGDVGDEGFESSQEELDTTSTPRKKDDELIEDQDARTGAIMTGNSTETLRIGGEHNGQGLDVALAEEGSRNSGSDDRKSEDVFLNIAHSEAGGQELMTWSERRKVRLFKF
jgi:hypothetical protein